MKDEQLERMLTQYGESMQFNVQRIPQEVHKRRRVSPKRMIALVAVAAMLLTGTVFADEIGKVLKQIAGRTFDAGQYSELDSIVPPSDPEAHTGQIIYYDQDIPIVKDKWIDDLTKGEWVQFKRIDEVRDQLDFHVVEPSFLPDGFELAYAEVLKYEHQYEMSIYYRYLIPGEQHKGISLRQTFIGEENKIDVKTLAKIERLQLGDKEVLLKMPYPDGDQSCVELIWVQQGSMFELEVWGLSREIALKIAASIG